MITTPINNYADLVRERKRLKKEIAHYEPRLKDNIIALEQSFKPVNIAVDFAHKMVEPSHEGLISQGVSSLVGGLASTLFGGYAWPIRYALTQVSKNVASKYVTKQAPSIVGYLTTWLKKKRERKLIDNKPNLKVA